jgi:predicted pyridoxine 5'-phosphate oxidase superfamily flavin-nucleotide-binding protein
MTAPGWPHAEPPFHPGEQALQARLGPAAAQRMHEIGLRVMRSAMPEQHRELFERLPFVVLGLLDADGQPWCTLAAGAPGFVRTPDAGRVAVGAPPLGAAALGLRWSVDAPVGMLGIEPATRRRNRVNGRIAQADAGGFAFSVAQSFGNCPQYIQARPFTLASAVEAGPPVYFAGALPPFAAALVAAADTAFIATASPDPAAANGGLDASHRGGRPGFVQVQGARLTIPDYAGNRFFNTLGNIALRPQAGLAFADWASGGLLLLTGRAAVQWDGPAVEAEPQAERLLVVDVDAGCWLPGALPWRSTAPPEFAPQLR